MRDETSERLYALLFDLNWQWHIKDTPMHPLEVIRNEFLSLLEPHEHIAVDASNTPIARASDLAALKKAAPDAAAYFSAVEFMPTKPDEIMPGLVKVAPFTDMSDTPKPESPPITISPIDPAAQTSPTLPPPELAPSTFVPNTAASVTPTDDAKPDDTASNEEPEPPAAA